MRRRPYESHVPRGEVAIDIALAPDLPSIHGDPHQLRQLFTNLLTNAFEALAGRGTVRILAGEYRLRNAVYLQSNVNLAGEGDRTRLIKEPSATTPLSMDSDWYDQEITLKDATGFRVGDGVCLRAKDAKTGRQVVLKRTLVARAEEG